MTLILTDGVASTINCANYVYFLALEKCSKLGHADAIQVFIDELLLLHQGQGLDILWRERCICPTGMLLTIPTYSIRVCVVP